MMNKDNTHEIDDDKHELDLHVALTNLLDRYLEVVNCVSGGLWHAEAEDEVIEARKALSCKARNKIGDNDGS